MYKTIIILILIATAVAGMWWFISSSEPAAPQPQGETMKVRLYYYQPALDQGPGGVQCSEAGLVSVERIVAADTDIAGVINLLLQGQLTGAERSEGIETEFPLDGVELISATGEGGVLTLTFTDPQNKTSGGSCRVSILWHQIERTTREFTGATQVRFMPEELFQP